MSGERWRFIGSCSDGGPFDLRPGLNVWAYPWTSLQRDPPPAPTGDAFADMAAQSERVVVADPVYGEKKHVQVWTIDAPEGRIAFAAGEFSNTIWGFYLPDES